MSILSVSVLISLLWAEGSTGNYWDVFPVILVITISLVAVSFCMTSTIIAFRNDIKRWLFCD